jgi:iduronate 2-sulfatase
MASQQLTLLLLPALATTATQALPPRPAQPNVLFLVSDDLRPQLDVPGYGADSAPITTPRLAALAAESFVFTRAYCQEALCAPSRNSFREPTSVAACGLLAVSTGATLVPVQQCFCCYARTLSVSGRRPDTTKSWQFVDHFREHSVGGDKWTALPQLFRQRGWTTVGAGKIYHPGLPPNNDLPKSWDPRMSDGTWPTWMYPTEPPCPGRTVGCGIDDQAHDPEDRCATGPWLGDMCLFEDSQTTAVALEQLRNVSELEAPFFVAVGFRKPHVSWRIPKRVLDAYPPIEDIPLPAQRAYPVNAPPIAFHQPVDDFLQSFTDVRECDGNSDKANGTALADWAVGSHCSGSGKHFNDTCTQTWRRQYWAAVSYLDENVGKMLDELEKLGHTDATIVSFFGDHGW